MPDSNYVPLMFQAQVRGRSQIQRLIPQRRADQQAYDWAEQWQQACDTKNIPQFESHIQTRECLFPWRMVTNSGQDAGIIRPVIGERGWAYFPGSSMKGAFLRACKKLCSVDETLLFCGGLDKNRDKDEEIRPGILRFHGGYPKDATWLNNSLVDIVHPQENWQTKNQDGHSAFIQISLYKPTFIFGISSSKLLTEDEWEKIWQVWQTALEQGIGSRVSAGYGQIATHTGNKLVGFGLSGQGPASKLINGDGEFRPNVFKASLRGHTRRLFNGITDEITADKLTKILWGGINRGENAIIGLLGIAFSARDLEIKRWQSPNNRNNTAPIYEIENATLNVLSMQSDSLTLEQKEELKNFTIRLIKFAMLLGGFGKSWRRSDHRIFLKSYKEQLIGCHWTFTKYSYPFYILFGDNLTEITKFLNNFRIGGERFSWLKSISNQGDPASGVRESWCKDNVQVWGRLAESEKDCLAIKWLHIPYKAENSIKQTYLTGWSSVRELEPKTLIGRLWHRMYPQFCKTINDAGKPIWTPTGKYAELLTIFPNIPENEQEQQKVNDFLLFLDQDTNFKQLW
jgi:CRISPR-associated protein Cmr6